MRPYDSVLTVTKTYLGPAAESFLARQCQLALKIEAKEITKAQFKELSKAVEIAAVRFIESSKAVELAKKIEKL